MQDNVTNKNSELHQNSYFKQQSIFYQKQKAKN